MSNLPKVMPPHATRPPPIMAFEPGSFAAFTVAERLPTILIKSVADLPGDAARDHRWTSLIESVTRGDEIAVEHLAPITDFWARQIECVSGRRWRDLSFLGLEFFFYHAINSIAALLVPGWDVFASQKSQGLRQAVGLVRSGADALPSLEEAITSALLGNMFDLSQINKPRQASRALLVDERRELATLLSAPRYAPIHIIADNAGAELVSDLVFIARLLEIGWSVQLHVKPWPMFVSDATEADVADTLLVFASSEAPDLELVADILRGGQDSGSFIVKAAADWGEPRCLDALSPPLMQQLRSGAAVLFKGDLNYRRVFGDLRWASDTPVDKASLAPPMKAFALRVLKSDLAVGIPPDRADDLDLTDPTWRTSGLYAVVQAVSRKQPRERGSGIQ